MNKQILSLTTAKQLVRCIILTSEIHDLWFAIENECTATYLTVYNDNVNMGIESFRITKKTANKLKQIFPQYIF